jgi:hypothetical protein
MERFALPLAVHKNLKQENVSHNRLGKKTIMVIKTLERPEHLSSVLEN